MTAPNSSSRRAAGVRIRRHVALGVTDWPAAPARAGSLAWSITPAARSSTSRLRSYALFGFRRHDAEPGSPRGFAFRSRAASTPRTSSRGGGRSHRHHRAAAETRWLRGFGYAGANSWFRNEGYHAGTARPPLPITADHNQFGIQVIASKPVRIH
jgi:hypothetical protein